MVDRCWQVLEESLQGSGVAGVEGRGALRADFQCRLLEPAGMAAGEDDIGTLSPGPPGCLEPDACAAADHDDGLPGQFRFALGGSRSGCAGHDSSGGWCRRPGNRSPAPTTGGIMT